MMQLNSNEIAQIIPHRYPFALVDKIVDGEVGKWARGVKCVTVNEPFFQGHFPQYHVMPGPLPPVPRDARRAHPGGPGPGGGGGHALPAGKQGEDRPVRRDQKRPLPQTGHPRRRTGAGVYHRQAEGPRGGGPVAVAEARATVDGKPACTAELTFALAKEG